MVNDKPDQFAYNQFAARDLAVPRFGRSQAVSGAVQKPIRSIAWSCDGTRVATGTELKGLRIWQAKATIEASASFSLPSSSRTSPHNGHVAAVAFSPVDPDILVSGCKSSSAGGCIVVWNLTTPKEPLATFKIAGDVLHIAFHPSGRQFAVVCPRGGRDEVYFYHLTLEEKWETRTDISMGGPASDIGFDEINSLRFNNSGKVLCAVSNDGSINAWAFPVQVLPIEPEVEKQEVVTKESLSSTPREATSDAGKDVEMDEGTEGGAKESGQGEGEGEKEALGGDVEMAETEEQPVNTSIAPSRIPSPTPAPLPAKKAKQLVKLRHAVYHSASLLALGFDPVGRFLAVGGQDASLSLLDTRDWISQRTFDVTTGAIRHIVFSPDGELIAIGGDDSYIAVVSVFTGGLVAKISVQGTVNAVCWHPKKNWLAWSTTAKVAVPVWHVIHQE